MRSCAETSESGARTRLVRLACMFLQLLVRNKVVTAKDLVVETQAFCVEFMHVKEAATLFRLLKELEGGEEGGGGEDAGETA